MKNLPLFLTLVFIALNICGQSFSWAPKGATWKHGIRSYWDPHYSSYEVWTSTGDTLWGGHMCKAIEIRDSRNILRNRLFTYEDSNRVFLYVNNKFVILYDFNKNAGDTLSYNGYGLPTMSLDSISCEIVVKIDSTSIITLNGYPLKVQYVSTLIPRGETIPPSIYQSRIIEHIGNLYQPVPNFIECYNACPSGHYSGLRCYEDNYFGFYGFVNSLLCEYTTDGIDRYVSTFGLNIFPNPASQEINLSVNNYNNLYEFNIYDINGKVIKSGVLEPEHLTININELTDGIYNLEIIADYKSEIKRFVVAK